MYRNEKTIEEVNELIFMDEPDIREWFIKAIPIAIKRLKDSPTSLPNDFLYKELKKHKKQISATEFHYSKRKEKIKLRNIIIKNAQKRWIKILDSVIYHCKESLSETFSFKWKYMDEWKRCWEEYQTVHSFKAEKEKGNWGKHVINFGKGETYIYQAPIIKYKMSEIEQYKEIDALFSKECDKARKYKKRHEKKALELFIKYFDLFCCDSELRTEDLNL